MHNKMRLTIIILCFASMICACRKNNTSETNINTTQNSVSTSDSSIDFEKDIPAHTDSGDFIQTEAPKSNDELYKFILEKWKAGDVSEIYQYASDDIKSIAGGSFDRLFLNVNETFGNIAGVENEAITVQNGTSVYTATLIYENVKNDVVMYIRDNSLAGLNSDIRFVNSFDITYDDGVVETYFLLNSDGYELNAVYTHSNETGPTVLLIPGSGMADYNETIGFLTPFKDIALGLAKQGIGSLRFEKRTYRYRENPATTIGLEEEYFDDCNNAIEWLISNGVDNIYLLGHSLGAQIAPALAEQNDVSGLILFNGTARHLADIIKDQYIAIDPDNSEYYTQFAEPAKAVTDENATGLYYYGVSDYYWASYNKLTTIQTIKQVGLPTLIMNSTADKQVFIEDISLWKDELADNNNITMILFEDCSHFGYKIDTSNPSALYSSQEFPEEILETIVNFLE